MKILLRLALPTLTLASRTFHKPVYSDLKRDFLSCHETYGGGSQTCGTDNSHYCYDPSAGESCCTLDQGYCQSGDFCGPVAGFCCHNGEDPQTCATRLHFTVPSKDPEAVTSTLPPNVSVVSVTLSVDTSVTADAATVTKTSSSVSSMMPEDLHPESLSPSPSSSTSTSISTPAMKIGMTSSTTTLSIPTSAPAGTSMAAGEGSATGSGMQPELTALANMKQTAGAGMPFTGAAIPVRGQECFGLGLILLGVVMLGLEFVR